LLALNGIRILDLGQYVPNSLCTMILGDFGAEVIKVENAAPNALNFQASPKGEERRREAAFDALNRNKKSIGLNLKSEIGRQIFYKLSKEADVIIEGFRPGVVKRLAIDYETIKEINPRIIYCSLSGYGQDGPYKNLPGHDGNYLAVAGALSLFGNREGPPVAPMNLLGDFAGASLHGVMGVLIALLARSNTGRGQYVDISYTDGIMTFLTNLSIDYFRDGILPKRGETVLHNAYPYSKTYKTKDDTYVVICAIEPWFWGNLCRALGKEDYITYHCLPEHFYSKPEGDKWEEISSYLEQIFLTRTSDEWVNFLSTKDVPISKVNTFDEAVRDPQVLLRKMVIEIKDPTLGSIKQLGMAIKLSDTPGQVRSLAPLFGQHTKDVLQAAGYKPEEIEEMLEKGVVV